jgi:hypothetical protein
MKNGSKIKLKMNNKSDKSNDMMIAKTSAAPMARPNEHPKNSTMTAAKTNHMITAPSKKASNRPIATERYGTRYSQIRKIVPAPMHIVPNDRPKEPAYSPFRIPLLNPFKIPAPISKTTRTDSTRLIVSINAMLYRTTSQGVESR